MNRGVYILTLATFVTGTVELIIAGILNMISTELHVSLGTVGLLVSVYSLVIAFGTPIFNSLTARIERKKLLVVTMLIFIIGNIISVFSANFTILMVARVIIAVSCSIIVVNALTIASKIVKPEIVGRAMGLVFMGISASLVLGIPLGTFIAEQWGWRMTFVLIAVLSAVSILGILKFLPSIPPQPAVPIRAQLSALKSTKIISAQMMVAFMLIGHFTIYTYFSPFLERTMGLNLEMISLMLLIFGFSGVLGGWIGGWSTDKFGGAKAFLIIMILFSMSLFALPFATSSYITLIPIIVIWGILAWAPAAPVQSYLIQTSPETAEIQISLFTSFMHLGVAIGSAFGGYIINHYPVTTNAWIGGFMGLLAFIVGVYSVMHKKNQGRNQLSENM